MDNSSDGSRPAGYEPTLLPSSPMAEGPSNARRLEGEVLADRYRVEALLGEGGMGAVYRVRHIHMHKLLALKVLHREMVQLPEAVARFEREAIAAARIEHPNVAAATDFGRLADGSFYLVLEYVEGRSLRHLLVDGPIAAERCARIGKQIAAALGAAHAHDIVHRDLKPENVMLVDRPNEPEAVKVLDFGIAKLTVDNAPATQGLTRMGAVFGTPEYMSPEQALGETVDHRSDLYSLGIILYEMASGRRPFDADDAVAVLAQQIKRDPPPLPEEVPPSLVSVILRLLAKGRDDRIQTAADVVAALDAIIPPPPSRMPTNHAIVVAQTAPTALVSRPKQPAPLAPIRAAAQSAMVEGRRLLGQIHVALRKQIPVGRTIVPAWVPVALGCAALLVVFLFVLLIVALIRPSTPALVATPGGFPMPEPSAAAPADSPKKKPVDPEEISRLEGVAVYKRSLEDWLTLGRGYAAAGKPRDSVLAYRAALQLNKAPRNDPEMLDDLREAAKHLDAFGLVINLCEARRAGLGEAGLELLWDIWVTLQADKNQQGSAESALKKLVILSRRTSQALRVAIELANASRCETVSDLLERASKYGDERVVARLTDVQQHTDCDPDKTDNCFRCLRESEALANAIERAKARSAPKLQNGYR